MTEQLRLGLSSFGDITLRADGEPFTHAEVIRQVVDQGALADEVGAASLSVSEHHRPDFAMSNPDTVLAAIASRTFQIRLGTAGTVLSSDEPVRVYERFATLDALSNGRAEVTLGRGSFTESFPLFGYSPSDYGVLFNEKLDLFSKLLTEKPVTWSGTTRTPLADAEVYPKTTNGLETWVGVRGTPASVTRTTKRGTNLIRAIIGGSPPTSSRSSTSTTEISPAQGNLPGWSVPTRPGISPTRMNSRSRSHLTGMHVRHGRSVVSVVGMPSRPRASFPASTPRKQPRRHAFTREDFIRDAGPSGSTYVGSPESVAKKIANTVNTPGLNRVNLNCATPTDNLERLLRSIKLYGTKVIPPVRDMLA